MCGPVSAAIAQAKPPVQDSTVIPAYRMRLMGVYDDRTGEPVEGVDVTDVMNGLSTKTTSTGTVALAFLPDGGALVRIRKIGYEPQTMMVTIAPTDTVPITVILKKVTELAAIAVVDSAPRYVSAGLKGFEDRRLHAATGYYVPEAVVRKDENRSIGPFLLAHIPNIHVREARGGQTFLDRSPRCGAGGAPAVYLDNVLLNNGRTPVNLAEIQLTDIAGVEYYANTATAPPEFNRTASSCGALVFWSREK
jgi:hypothetical protein